ncbi:MAG: 50S ribosomal protein L18 [Chloroflexi bacterium RBG_16_54_11]|nr:MAG: 50S ribosomal protein L18 [Chloroflexi bacterium RBG_16_54_11]
MASNQKTRSAARNRRHIRVRQRIFGTPSRPRLCVYRSLLGIYAQVIDDVAGNTLVSASTVDPALRAQVKDLKQAEKAHLVGKTLAERALSKGIKEVSFDRGGYKYIGRVKALAEGAREGGLKF